jgi:hypothetical protein
MLLMYANQGCYGLQVVVENENGGTSSGTDLVCGHDRLVP